MKKAVLTILPTVFLVIMVWLTIGLQYPLPAEAPLLLWLTRLDPLLLAATVITAGWPTWWWLPVTVLAVTILWGRVFCGWVCPVGGMLNLLQILQESTGRQNRRPAYQFLSQAKQFRWYWLAAALALLAAGTNWILLFTPFHLLTESIVEITQRRIPWLLGLLVMLGVLIIPRFWCVCLCPTGLVLSLFSRWRRGLVIGGGCTRCDECHRRCPMGAASPDTGEIGDDCILCFRCYEACPVSAVAVSKNITTPIFPIPSGSSRRVFLKAVFTAAGAYAVSPVLLAEGSGGALRPPGALDGSAFALSCSRCGRCMRACPSQCLQPMPMTAGFTNYLSPQIVPRKARCELCLQCQAVCPTGAIEQCSEDQVAIGMAEINYRSCIAWTEGKLCLVCREQCPRQAVEMDDKKRPSIDQQRCVGCGACENACPLEDAAVVVRPQ